VPGKNYGKNYFPQKLFIVGFLLLEVYFFSKSWQNRYLFLVETQKFASLHEEELIMRMSKMFSQTLREAPADARVTSHQLLERAGFIRQLAAGIFSYLPLAQRSLTKIENIMREEINAIGGQEVTMPVTNPADIWQETQRWYQIGSEMARFKDRNDRDMLLMSDL
jgi:hypothetical protein